MDHALISNSVSSSSFHTFTNPHSSTSKDSCNGNKFECRVCEEGFGLTGDKIPRLLFCGHTLCHSCLVCLYNPGDLEEFDSDTMANQSFILCPFDRQPTAIGPSGVWGLKKNFALMELLERLFLSPIDPCLPPDILSKQRELGIRCDEDESHAAVLYCTVCASHLCLACSESTHSTKTLHIHKRIPLSEKPREKPRCVDHTSQPVEFVCLEESCRSAPLMCFICKDYKHRKHKHGLLEQEAERMRSTFSSALQKIREVAAELREVTLRLDSVAVKLEGDSAGTDEVGTAGEARVKVEQYFRKLRELLQFQETAALRVIDTHVRERICSIRQHQEDVSNLLSQMVSLVRDGERAMQQDDGRLVAVSGELADRIASISNQEQQMAQIVNLAPDSAIPITFTKDNRVHIGTRIEMRVVTLGLDGAGKTSILFQLKSGEFVSPSPTIGFNVETIDYKNFKFTVWDVGGQMKLRPLWRHYYFNTQAVIFVVDAENADRLNEAQTELAKLMSESELKDASLLIFANKSLSPRALSIGSLVDALNLYKTCLGRTWHLQTCDAQTGFGLDVGLDWLARQLVPSETIQEEQ